MVENAIESYEMQPTPRTNWTRTHSNAIKLIANTFAGVIGRLKWNIRGEFNAEKRDKWQSEAATQTA